MDRVVQFVILCHQQTSLTQLPDCENFHSLLSIICNTRVEASSHQMIAELLVSKHVRSPDAHVLVDAHCRALRKIRL